MRVVVRVRPGARHAAVGGSYGDALVVRVTERAVDGRATAATRTALAEALGLRVVDVVLISGARSRTKIYQVPDSVAEALLRLRKVTPDGA